MGSKMAAIFATLTLTYLEENYYEIMSNKIRQRYIRRIYKVMEKIFEIIISYFGNAHGETLTNYTT